MNKTAEYLAVVEKEMQLNIDGVDYQSAKVARRASKKGADEHEKIRHPSDASHCSSEKSVGEFDAAESLIVLSSANSQKEKHQSSFKSMTKDSYQTVKVEEDELQQPEQNEMSSETLSSHFSSNGHHSKEMRINRNPMDLSSANQTTSMIFQMQNNLQTQKSTSFTPNPTNFNLPSNQQPSVTNTPVLHNTMSQIPQHQLHRQVMTVTPVVDHVALVDTVLNAPSLPTMVIPMDDLDQHRIQHAHPNNIVKNTMASRTLVSHNR
jgi:hypothetical protein